MVKDRLPKVCVIGLGLIGGSLALALKESGAASAVVGYDVDSGSTQKAVQMGAIDEAEPTLKQAVGQSDVVFLCTPIPVILDLLPQVAGFVRTGTVVTDVGSTKRAITAKARQVLPSTAVFVGGHPMAGSEKGGIGAADPYLFENAIYVLTPEDDTPVGAVSLLKDMVHSIGAKPVVLSSQRHDEVVAAISHLPHLVASALAGTVAELSETEAMMVELAAGGFRDTTRVAAGDAQLWNGILMSNKEPVLSAIDAFQKMLARIRRAIETEDAAELIQVLHRAAVFRKSLPKAARGLLSTSYELTVRVVDEPGMLSKITTLLAEVGINIMDIEILHIREGEGGALRLAVPSHESLTKALTVLQGNGYQAWSR